MRKRVALLLIAVLAVSSLFIVGSVFAQSIPKPSVPEFSVEFVDFYDVPPVYEVDPNTGETVIIQEGFRSDLYHIVVTVKNQPFTPYNDTNGNLIGMYYFLVVRNGSEQHWSDLGIILSSDSEYTESAYIFGRQAGSYVLRYLKPGDKLYFKMQAVMSTIELSMFDDDFISEMSDWSDTQTFTIPDVQTPSPEPTSTPFNEPQLSAQEIILGVAITVAVIGVGVSLLIHLIKKK